MCLRPKLCAVRGSVRKRLYPPIETIWLSEYGSGRGSNERLATIMRPNGSREIGGLHDGPPFGVALAAEK